MAFTVYLASYLVIEDFWGEKGRRGKKIPSLFTLISLYFSIIQFSLGCEFLFCNASVQSNSVLICFKCDGQDVEFGGNLGSLVVCWAAAGNHSEWTVLCIQQRCWELFQEVPSAAVEKEKKLNCKLQCHHLPRILKYSVQISNTQVKVKKLKHAWRSCMLNKLQLSINLWLFCK